MTTLAERSNKTKQKGMKMFDLHQITDENRGLLLAALRNGGTRSEACKAAGIDPADLHAWLLRGTSEPPEEPFATLFDDVECAEAQADVEAQSIIHKIGTGRALEPGELERFIAISPERDWCDIAAWLDERERQRAERGSV